MSTRRYSQEDLLRLPAASLQAALLKAGDAQLLQALKTALPQVRSAIMGGLSARRRLRIQAEFDHHNDGSRDASPRSSNAAMIAMLQHILGASAPQEPVQHGVRPCSIAANEMTATGAEASEPPADLSRGAFERLKAARGIVGTLVGLSNYARNVAACRSAMTGAVLLKTWMGLPAHLSREVIYRNLSAAEHPTSMRSPKSR